ncbi:MAG: dihydroorotase [Halobacteriota archaeon]|nr:dihydroorotase [Halobacteriota archaeon]
MEYTITNARIFFQGRIQSYDLLIRDGKIVKIGRDLKADSTVDARGLLILPGGIDSHVHFRDMGEAHKENWFTGSSSAAAGGVTTVIEHPNTVPPTTTVPALKKKLMAAEISVVDYGINAGVTGDYEDLISLKKEGITAFGEIFMADLEEEKIFEALKIARETGTTACMHAEDRKSVLEDPKRPEICEINAIESVLKMKKSLGVKLHICHLSTKRGLELLKGRKITKEVTPHHLLLSKDDFERAGSFAKMNPPLRDESDRASLWQGMREGDIDIMASDHAPHTIEEKSMQVLDAPSGVPGVETMIPLMLPFVKKDIIPLERLVALASHNPARIFGLESKGAIEVGKDADLIFIDMKAEEKIKPDKLHSKCCWTPFEGKNAIFPVKVLIRGEIVFEDGTVKGKAGFGNFLRGSGSSTGIETKS